MTKIAASRRASAKKRKACMPHALPTEPYTEEGRPSERDFVIAAAFDPVRIWEKLEAESDRLHAQCAESEKAFRRAARWIYATMAPLARDWRTIVIYEGGAIRLILSTGGYPKHAGNINAFARCMPESLRGRWQVTAGLPRLKNLLDPPAYAATPEIRPETVRVRIRMSHIGQCSLSLWSKELGEVRRTDPAKADFYADQLIDNAIGEAAKLRNVYWVVARGPSRKKGKTVYLTEFRRHFFKQYPTARDKDFESILAEPGNRYTKWWREGPFPRVREEDLSARVATVPWRVRFYSTATYRAADFQKKRPWRF